MFIPAVAQKLMKENERRAAGGKDWLIPLGGAALGNGWIDATIQGRIGQCRISQQLKIC